MRKPPQPRAHSVDLTPVLGLVAILIPMLLMAYTPHVLAVIESDPPSLCAGDCTGGEAEQVVPVVTVSRMGLILSDVVVESGTPTTSTDLPCAGSCQSAADYDWSALQDTLALTRDETTSTGTVTIVPAGEISYDVVVAALDACRERIHPDGTREPLYHQPRLGSAG